MTSSPELERDDQAGAGATQSEIRVMYIWTDRLRAMLPLIHMGRGKMMGVDYNKGLRWVGASAGFIAD